jgi:hypothetical protein
MPSSRVRTKRNTFQPPEPRRGVPRSIFAPVVDHSRRANRRMDEANFAGSADALDGAAESPNRLFARFETHARACESQVDGHCEFLS